MAFVRAYRGRHAAGVAALLLIAVSAAEAQAQTAPIADRLAAADDRHGARIALRCKACHTLDKGGKHKLGPNLWNVVGRDKAHAPGFKYSKAMKALRGRWDEAALDRFLENPKTFAPGNRMAFPGLKSPADRAHVIAYLRTLSDSPPATPARAAPSTATAADHDYGGLPAGDGREETFAICGACHSLRLVTQQGLPADRWDDLMDWMTEKQGMPALERPERAKIVAYLAKYYGPDRAAAGTANPMMPARNPMAPTMPLPPPE